MSSQGVIRFGVLFSLMIAAGCSRQHDHSHDHDHAHGHDHTHVHKKEMQVSRKKSLGAILDMAPHHGILVPFSSKQALTGYAELKLHDDKGDLELWLTKDAAGAGPYDLALNSVITVTFPDLNQKKVELRVRNSDKNEDEAGKGNIRDNKTNYFIFPGETGIDAAFLVGKDFSSKVVITFSDGGVEYSTDPFELRPHTH